MKTRKFRSFLALMLVSVFLLSVGTACQDRREPTDNPSDAGASIFTTATADPEARYRAAYQNALKQKSILFPGITLPEISADSDGLDIYRFIADAQKEGRPYATAVFLHAAAAVAEEDGVRLNETANRTEVTDAKARAFAILLYQLDQDPKTYVHSFTGELLDNPEKIHAYNWMIESTAGIYVCTEYQRYGYESTAAYLEAVQQDRTNYKGGIYWFSQYRPHVNELFAGRFSDNLLDTWTPTA